MNAVTTAEYVVFEEIYYGALETKLNQHAQLGFKLAHFTETPPNDVDDGHFTAVMMRESTHTSALAERVTAMAEDVISLEKRIEEIEAKIDWSK